MASGRDLSDWTKDWLETSGVNTLQLDISQSDDAVVTAAQILQSAAAQFPVLRMHRIGIGLYNKDQAGNLVRTGSFEVDVTAESTPLPQLVGQVRPDLILLNDEDLAYAKIRLDAASWQAALQDLSRMPDSLARALVWGAAWDATRDGQMPARTYLELVRTHIHAEDQSTTLRTTLGQAVLAARSYVASQHRAAELSALGDALLQLAKQAAAGSDQQLQFVKYLAQVATTPQQVQFLQQLLDGEVTLPGLKIDADLGWELLDALVGNQCAGVAEISHRLSADETASGKQAAARAEASIGTAAAKREAFDLLVNSADLPNAIVRAITQGLGNVNDGALLVQAGLIESYFSGLLGIWESRSHAIAEALVVGLYPAGAVSAAGEQLLQAGQEWLAQNATAPAALRRLVLENVAGTSRAVDAQKCDAAG